MVEPPAVRASLCQTYPTVRRPNVVAELALGLASNDEIDAFSGHILACNRCAETLAALDASDTLASILRQIPGGAIAAPDAVMARVMEQACQLHAVTANSGDTAGVSVTSSRDEREAGQARSSSPQAMAGLLAPPQSEDELGRLGPYRVLKLLDSGGMGMVSSPKTHSYERSVALKAMKPHLAGAPKPADDSAQGAVGGGLAARQYRYHPPRGRGSGRAVAGDGVARRRIAGQAAEEQTGDRRAGSRRDWPPDCRGPDRRPQPRADPPRCQACEHLAGDEVWSSRSARGKPTFHPRIA